MSKTKLELASKHCYFCGTQLERKSDEVASNWRTRKYCGSTCWYSRNTGQSKQCLACNKQFFSRRREGVSHFKSRKLCSIRCVSSWREQQYETGLMIRPKTHSFGQGVANPNWKGGITPKNEIIRRSTPYKDWRTAVFERDNYTCVFCGKKGGNLEADHVKQFAYYPEHRFDLSNGRTLCKPCHRTTTTYGFSKKVKYE